MSSIAQPAEAERGAASPEVNAQVIDHQPAKPGRGSATYRPMLDVVRFFAAIWVMLSHAEAVRGGGHAVAIFFVLSGYLIGGQLVDEKRRTGKIRLPEFYFKRVTRIWLPYYIVLFGMIALFVARKQNAIPGFNERMFAALTYTYNLINEIRGNIHPTWVTFNQIWSLSIEEQFYLVVPLLIGWIPFRSVVPVSLVLTIVFMLFLPIYAGLFLGVLMAALWDQNAVSGLPRRTLVPMTALFLASVVFLFVVGQGGIKQDAFLTYFLSCIAVLLANYIPLPKSTHTTLRYLGLMTYSYYLIHEMPNYFLGALYRRLAHASEIPVWMHVGFGLLALPLSYAFVRWIELPALRVRGRMLKEKSPLVKYAPALAWGVSLVGIAGLVYSAWH